MPGLTDRAKNLRSLYHARKRILIDQADSDTEAVDAEMEENLELEATILSRRTLKRPSTYRNKGFNADAHFQDWITEQKYVVFTHMTRTSFMFVP